MQTGTVRRAFELAESGEFQSIPEIAACLKKEQYDTVEAHLSGSLIKKQLHAAMHKAA